MGTLQAVIVFIVGYIVIDKIDVIVSRMNQYKTVKSIIEDILISPKAKNKQQTFALYLLLICIVALLTFL
jgi:predicted nucleic-acid-binding protein